MIEYLVIDSGEYLSTKRRRAIEPIQDVPREVDIGHVCLCVRYCEKSQCLLFALHENLPLHRTRVTRTIRHSEVTRIQENAIVRIGTIFNKIELLIFTMYTPSHYAKRPNCDN